MSPQICAKFTDEEYAEIERLSESKDIPKSKVVSEIVTHAFMLENEIKELKEHHEFLRSSYSTLVNEIANPLKLLTESHNKLAFELTSLDMARALKEKELMEINEMHKKEEETKKKKKHWWQFQTRL